MQFLGMNWLVFGAVWMIVFLICCLYALLVRVMANSGVDGQTAWMVVVGVVIVLVGLAFVAGLEIALIAAALFVAGGIPMIIEYVSRVEKARKTDHAQAKEERKHLL